MSLKAPSVGVCALFCVMAGCGSSPTVLPGSSTYLLPNISYNVMPGLMLTSEQVVLGALAGAAVYFVYDPLAPNWKIQEQVLGDGKYRLSMMAKAFRVGGDGEAMRVMKRRAETLVQEQGFTSYRILSYVEGIESSTPFPARFGEATIELVREVPPPQALPKKP